MGSKVAVVSGSTSFVGSGLIEYLIGRNIKVYALCRLDSKNKERLPKHPLVIPVDYDFSRDNPKEFTLPEPCDVFYHFAWSTGEKSDYYLQNQNVKYTLDGVHLAKRLGCKRFLFAGSQGEYGLANVPLEESTPCFPVTGYGMAKLCAGQMGRAESEKIGIDFLWTRILSVYGEKDNPNTLYSYLVGCFTEGVSPELTPCTQIWDYMPIEICSQVLFQVMEQGSPEKIYVIGSGEEVPLKDFVLALRDKMAPEVEVHFGVRENPKETPTRLCTKERYCGFEIEGNPEPSNQTTGEGNGV